MRAYIQIARDLMTDTVTTLATGNISEEVIAEYLQGLGIDVMEPLWYELEHTIRPWIPQFLAGGGSYGRKVQAEGYDHKCVPHPRHLAMVGSHGGKSVELRLHNYNAYTSIHLIHPYGTNYFHDCPDWCGVEVQPRYLDIVLCSMLGVPIDVQRSTSTGLRRSPLTVDLVIPLVPRFLGAEGKLEKEVDTRSGTRITGVRASYRYRSVLLASPTFGSSCISLLQANYLYTGFWWEELKVESDRLDAVLCDLLGVSDVVA